MNAAIAFLASAHRIRPSVNAARVGMGLAIVASVLAAASTARAAERQWLVNGGFEAAPDPQGMPPAWTSQGTPALSAEAFSGNAALHVEGGYVIASQRLEAPELAGRTVTISFRARGDGTAKCGAIILCHDGTRYRPSRWLWDAAPSPFQYRRFARTLQLPAEATGAFILNIYNTAKAGNVWLDDISLLTAAARTPDPRNIARRCSYDMAPQPRYGLCTDADDASQLTDGVFTVPGRSLWAQQEAVGWLRTPQVEITLDLGSPQTIGGLVYHTAAGAAGVHLPVAIETHVSLDGDVYGFVGNLIEMNETPFDPDCYAVVPVMTTKLSVRARYVRLSIVPFGMFAFCDEIEVLPASPDAAETELHADTPTAAASRQADIRRRLVTLAARRRLLNDFSAVIDQMLTAPDAGTATAAARALLPQLEQFEFVDDPNAFRAVIPLNDLHRDVFRLHAAALRGDREGTLTYWQTRPEMPLDLFAQPNDVPVDLHVELMRNECRALTFNVTNSHDAACQLRFSLDGLPAGRSPNWIACYQVEYVDTSRGRVAHSALTPLAAADGVYTTDVPPGMTRQVWLSVHPVNVPPGEYGGTVSVQEPGGARPLPLRVHVLPLMLPARPTFAYQVWDYTNSLLYSLTDGNRAAVLETLKSHFVNVAWAARDAVPWPDEGDVDRAGNLLRPPDFSRFEQWLRSRADARYYLMFDYRLGRDESFLGFTPGSAEFERVVSQWAAALARHVKELGIAEAQVGMLIKDEPRTPEHFELTRKWATAIKAGSRDILLFIDPGPGVIDVRSVPGAAEALKLCDIICPCTVRYEQADEDARAFFAECAAEGKQLWFYDATSARDADPCFHYRGRAWHCWAHGATGGGDWSLAAAGCPNSWNEYITPGALSYSPLYVTPDGVSTSKQWEAAREGVQDYEILHMLSTLASAAPDNERKAEARTFLAQRPAQVAALTRARNPDAYEAMARARDEALALLCELGQ